MGSKNNCLTTYLDPSMISEADLLIFNTKRVKRIDLFGLLALENFLWSLMISDKIYVPYLNPTIESVREDLIQNNTNIIYPVLKLEYP